MTRSAALDSDTISSRMVRTSSALIILVFSLLGPGRGPLAGQEGGLDGSGFLLIHLDGVSSRVFTDELDRGNLENLRATFSEKGIIRHGVTFYPPFTPTVVHRLRHAQTANEGVAIDWGEFDRETGDYLGRSGVFTGYAGTVPRRARSNFLHGLPYMDPLAGLALWNLPEMVERYGSMEFYWFGTDTAGHMSGEAAQRRSLRRFDRYFPRLIDRLDDDVNVIVYADHGMTFGTVRDYDEEVASFLDGRIEYYAYPNVYLHDPADRAQVAEALVRETAQDLTFYEEAPGLVIGLDGEHRFAFHREGDRIRYDHGGADPLGYAARGYDGSSLTPDEWLHLTHDLEYPYTPVRILELFDNPRAGDVVTSLNDGKPKAGPWVRVGNHQALTATDMTVPVLVRGPALEHHYGRDYVRLEDLFAGVPAESFHVERPSRERHTMSVWMRDGPAGSSWAGDLSFSPRYRMRLGAEWNVHGDRRGWAMYDLTSGFLTRVWVGGGVTARPGTTFLGKLRYELRVRRVGAEARLSTADPARLDLFYRMGERLDVRVRNLEAVGLSVRF